MYTCKICNTEFKSVDPMGMHLSRKHNMTVETYYEQYIKKENEGKCEICGNPTKFLSIGRGYNPTCSFKCACTKGRITYKIKYGVSTPAKLDKTKENSKKHFEEKYGKGITTPFRSKEVQDKIKQTIQEKYDSNNAFLVKNENGEYKRDITNIKRYGYSCPMKNPIKSKEIIEQKREKYGTANNFDKIKETVQNKYNVNNSFLVKNEENVEKRTITCKEKYGYDNPGQVPEFKRKQMYGKYNAPNGKKYDSSWEYKFELYLIEHNIDYIYQSENTFTWYDVNGKSHEYIPDFYLPNTNEFIEIKGDYFFDKNGKFFDPYDKTEEGYKNAELKWNCMMENQVKVYTGKELKDLGIL